MHREAVLVSLASALVLTSPGTVLSAQNIPKKEAQIELAGYADCVVSRKSFRKNVDIFLRTVPDSATFYPASMKAADMTCLNGAAMKRHAGQLEMRLQPGTFRDALYPALYRRDFGRTGPPAAIATLAPLDFATEFEGGSATLSPDYRYGRGFGDCVARKSPQASHALLMSEPYVAAEDVAVEALKPSLALCLPAGNTVKIGRASLRAYLGEAMYKLAVAART